MLRFVKKGVALLLLSALLLSSCSAPIPESTQTGTEPGKSLESVTETKAAEEEKGYTAALDESTAALVATLTPLMTEKLSAKALAELPVASSEMSSEELRRLCLDYFTLQLSFQWTPSADVKDYPSTHYDFKEPKTLDLGTVYRGIPYQSMGVGNLYRFLEYYDEEKGVFDITTAFRENGGNHKTDIETDAAGNETYYKWRSMMIFFNQCSVASFWGWGRVINSASFAWTADMNICNGFIPVGGFTYGYEYEGKYYGPESIDRFGKKTEGNPKKYDTKDVIFDIKVAKGVNGLYQCYAQLQPADCLVSAGHTMMAKSVRLVYKEDGSVDYPACEVTVLEQIEGWGEISAMGSVPYITQGGIDRVYTFKKLQDSGYLPFTFAEFLEKDDPRLQGYSSSILSSYSVFRDRVSEKTGVGVEKAEAYCTLSSGGRVKLSDFQNMTVGSNYSISDTFVTVKNSEGKTLFQKVHRSHLARIREVAMTARHASWDSKDTVSKGLEAYTDKGYTVSVSLQLSTGEKITAFEGILVK